MACSIVRHFVVISIGDKHWRKMRIGNNGGWLVLALYVYVCAAFCGSSSCWDKLQNVHFLLLCVCVFFFLGKEMFFFSRQ